MVGALLRALTEVELHSRLTQHICIVYPIKESRDVLNTGNSHQQLDLSGNRHLRSLQASLTSGTVYQKDQAGYAYREALRQFRECDEIENMSSKNRLMNHLG